MLKSSNCNHLLTADVYIQPFKNIHCQVRCAKCITTFVCVDTANSDIGYVLWNYELLQFVIALKYFIMRC